MMKRYTKSLKNLGWKIQKLRKKAKFTQEELAHEMKVSRVYVGYIEQGRESPSLRLLMKIAKKTQSKN